MNWNLIGTIGGKVLDIVDDVVEDKDTASNIPESVQNSLLNIVVVGVGGYVMGRSAEKVVNKWQQK